jgi:hypothetical protein
MSSYLTGSTGAGCGVLPLYLSLREDPFVSGQEVDSLDFAARAVDARLPTTKLGSPEIPAIARDSKTALPGLGHAGPCGLTDRRAKAVS